MAVGASARRQIIGAMIISTIPTVSTANYKNSTDIAPTSGLKRRRNSSRATVEHPFFCYLATNAPHAPFNVEPLYSAPYQGHVTESRALFYGMIANIDENFGKLHHHLHSLNLENDTILIFMTDNGTAAGVALDEQGFVIDGYNAGLRGNKGSQYDGGHRVPFFIRWPTGEVRGGYDIDRLTANVDLMPTLLDLCQIEHNLTFHGKSLKPLLQKSQQDWPDRTLVTDSQRLTQPVKWRKSAVMTDRWRLIDGKTLFDMSEDREQRVDVAAQHPDVVSHLQSEYERWWAIVSEQFDREIPISIGTPDDTKVILTCHDWRNADSDCPWHQGMIREGYLANGYWEIEIAEDGLYQFELYRWPQNTQRSVVAGIDGDDIAWRQDWISDQYKNWYSGGVALSINHAQIKVERPHQVPIELTTQVSAEVTCAAFKIFLENGPAHLTTTFSTDKGETMGAYFVEVKLLY